MYLHFVDYVVLKSLKIIRIKTKELVLNFRKT